MRNTTLLLAVLVGSLLTSVAAVAASGSSTGRIQSVLMYEGHTGVLVRQENMSDLGACGRADFYILDDQQQYFKEMYALILTAHVSRRPVLIAVENCVQGISRIRHIEAY